MAEQKSKSGIWLLVALLVLLIGVGTWVVFLRPSPPRTENQTVAIEPAKPPQAVKPAANEPVKAEPEPAPPKEAPKETPKEPPKEAPKQPAPESPKEAPKEESKPEPDWDKMLGAGADMGGEPAEGETAISFILRGITVDTNNVPVPECDLSVHIFTMEEGAEKARGKDSTIASYSWKNGKFGFEVKLNLKRGRRLFVGVSANKTGYGSSSMAGAWVTDKEEVKGLRLELPKAITAQIRVVTEQGAGILEADVMLSAKATRDASWPPGVEYEACSYFGETDEKGFLELPVMRVGKYGVQVIVEGFLLKDGFEEIEVTGGQEKMVLPDLVMRRVVVIRARVLDENGKGIYAANRIRLYDMGGTEVANERVSIHREDGFLLNLPKVQPGRYRIVIEMFEGYEDIDLGEVEVLADGPTKLGDLKVKKEAPK